MSQLQIKPKECLLCNSNENIFYGDDEYGEMFCKLCFDRHSCFHCKKMNIYIYFAKNNPKNKENNIYISRNKDIELDISDPQKYEQKKVNNIIYKNFGDKERLFCIPCFNSEDVYHDPNDDNYSINNNDDMDDDDDFDEDEDEEEEDNNYNDAYYVRRGKYDLY
jgi:hypothetical protein